MNRSSFRPAGSDWDLCSVGHAVDCFVNTVKRLLDNTPLSTRYFRSVCKYRRAGEEACSRKIMSLCFGDHFSIGVCMPGPRVGGMRHHILACINNLH
jgi:hypothetical protein